MNKLIKYLKYNILILIGIIIGIIGGFIYWKIIGCKSGTCPITSSWFLSSIYGGLMGGLIFSLFKKEKENNNENPIQN